ncbi:hypothetical protein JCM10212_003216 [Sporobolomyces blumeae]
MTASDRSDFERERDRLVAEIAESLAKCVTATNQLNRNIENVTNVGAGFESVSNLWTQFGHVMGGTGVGSGNAGSGSASGHGATTTGGGRREDGNEGYGSTDEPLPPRYLDRSQDLATSLPRGVAPGGGDPNVLSRSVLSQSTSSTASSGARRGA